MNDIETLAGLAYPVIYYHVKCGVCGEWGYEVRAGSMREAAEKFIALGYTVGGGDAVCPKCDFTERMEAE